MAHPVNFRLSASKGPHKVCLIGMIYTPHTGGIEPTLGSGGSVYIAPPDPMTLGIVFLPESSFQISGETHSPRSLILGLSEDCLCPGEGPTAAPIRNPFIHTSAANYAESTDMPRSHLLSRKYLPSARCLVNCCVQSWLWIPYAPHSDEGQVQVAVPMPSSPEVPCYGIICLENPGVARQLALQLLFCLIWNESGVGQENWYRIRRAGDHFSVLISSVPGGIGGAGKIVFHRLRVFLIQLWKCIGFP